MAQIQYFLKLDGIKGESKHALHLGEIELLSCGFAEPRVLGTSSTGTSGGMDKARNMIVTKFSDNSSAPLLKACSRGEHLANAVITVRRTNGTEDSQTYRFLMEDIVIPTFQTSSDATLEIPVDSFTLNATKTTVEYNTSKPAPAAPPAPPKKKRP